MKQKKSWSGKRNEESTGERRVKEREKMNLLPAQDTIRRRRGRQLAKEEFISNINPNDRRRKTLLEIKKLKTSVAALKKYGLKLIKSCVKSTVNQLQCGRGLSKIEEKHVQKASQTSRKRQILKNPKVAYSQAEKGLSRKYKNKTKNLANETKEQRCSRLKRIAMRDRKRYAKETGFKDLYKEKFLIAVSNENAVFGCTVCNNKFENQIGLKLHFRHHTGAELWKARDKNSVTTEGVSDAQQSETDHHVVIVYKCEICSEKCYTIANYRKHIIDTHAENRELLEKLCFLCTFCDEMFNIRHQFVKHQRDVHDIFTQCPVCNENAATQELFMKHVSETHSDDNFKDAMVFGYAEGYFCKGCGFVHESYSKVLSHSEKAHAPSKCFECDFCEQIYDTKIQLNSHKRNFHGDKMLSCEICGHLFIDMNSLKSHRRCSHKLKTKKRVECEKCEKTFASSFNLRTHFLVIHQGKRPFKCNVCEKTFLSHSVLSQHKINVCEKDTKALNTCHICDKNFDTPLLLYYHKSNIHKYGNTEENVCHLCNKTIKNSSSLYYHNRSYHKITQDNAKQGNQKSSNLTCAVCEKTFPFKTVLFEHWRRHGDERPFQCSLCQLTFKHSSRFSVHKKSAHQDDLEMAKMITISGVYSKVKEDFNKAHGIQC